MTAKPHWTQTPEGRKRLSRQMKKYRRKFKSKLVPKQKGMEFKWVPAASAKATPVVGGQQVWPKPTVDIRSAIIYLRQAQGKSPRFAKALAELALLTLLGEDK